MQISKGLFGIVKPKSGKVYFPIEDNRKIEHRSGKAEWRRDKVLELSSQGRSQPQIARILQVGLGPVNRDLQYLRQEAKENIKKYHLMKYFRKSTRKRFVCVAAF